MSKRQRHSPELVARVLDEKARHRRSEDAWSDYIAALRHGPETDILVYSCELAESMLSEIWMAPVSSDVGEAISTLLAEHGDSFTMSKAGHGTRVEFSSTVDGVTYYGEGEHENGWATTASGRCARSDREPGAFDEMGECHALAVCLAILSMYSPTQEEIRERLVLA